jgi:RNA polymerase sigma-70 factor (ECF subfamily)
VTSDDPRQSARGEDPRGDEELLRAHAEGDPEAFAVIFRRHRDRLWAVALRTTGNRDDAAEALQEALLSAHRAAARFRGDAAVTTWLHRIVVNACVDRLRRRQAHPTVPLPGQFATDDDNGWFTGRNEPAAPAVDHDTSIVVRKALAQLPVEQRTAIVLVDLYGHSVAEVAEQTGVAEGTVKSRCSRGRARLAVILGHLRPATHDTSRNHVADADVPPNAATPPAGSSAGELMGGSGAVPSGGLG